MKDEMQDPKHVMREIADATNAEQRAEDAVIAAARTVVARWMPLVFNPTAFNSGMIELAAALTRLDAGGTDAGGR